LCIFNLESCNFFILKVTLKLVVRIAIYIEVKFICQLYVFICVNIYSSWKINSLSIVIKLNILLCWKKGDKKDSAYKLLTSQVKFICQLYLFICVDIHSTWKTNSSSHLGIGSGVASFIIPYAFPLRPSKLYCYLELAWWVNFDF